MQRRPKLSLVGADGSFENQPALESSVETVTDRELRKRTVRECLAEVEFPFYEVVALWLLHDMDPVQISTELDIPYNTARSRLARGKRQLEAAVRRRLAT